MMKILFFLSIAILGMSLSARAENPPPYVDPPKVTGYISSLCAEGETSTCEVVQNSQSCGCTVRCGGQVMGSTDGMEPGEPDPCLEDSCQEIISQNNQLTC